MVKTIDNFIYYKTNKGILLNGDAIEIMQVLDNNSIDLIVTSPPYNVGIDYSTWNDKLPVDEYFSFLEKTLRQFKRILKPDGRFAINLRIDISIKHTGSTIRLSPIAEVYKLIQQVGLNFNSIVLLEEIRPHRVKYTAWGSWLSASAPYIYTPIEGIIIGYNEQWKKLQKGKSTMTKEEFIELVSGSWKYTAETKKWTQANFSLDIPLKAIKILTFENDIVLDPFMGSGTTAIASEKLNRRWIGIEISKEYCEITKQRIIHTFEDNK